MTSPEKFGYVLKKVEEKKTQKKCSKNITTFAVKNSKQQSKN